MNLTQKLKDFLIENCGVDKDAGDEEFRAAVGRELAAEKSELTLEKFQELTAEPDAGEANEFLKAQQETNTLLKDTIDLLKGQAAGGDGASADGGSTAQDKGKAEGGDEGRDAGDGGNGKPDGDKEYTPTDLQKALVQLGGTEVEPGMQRALDVHVKEAVDQYDNTRKAMTFPTETTKGNKHAFAGQPVSRMGRPLYEASQRDKALAGAWAKFQILSVTPKLAGSPERAWEKLTPHERELLGYLAAEGEWDDSKDGRPGTRKGFQGSRGRGYKALIDDAGSGGLEAAPIVFDDQVIEAPLLFGELFPLVNEVPLDRGRRVEGVSVSRVTGSWGGVDDTSITLFNTASFVSAFDTTIYRWEGSVKIGLDFLGDTPIDFGATMTRQYGERLLEDLDDVIATGNGTTQPEGVINKSGITTVAFGAATSVGNYESLRYGVAKPELRGPMAQTAVYCGTETSYQRVRALPVGASDARRIFGLDHFGADGGGYVIGPGKYRINESLSNAQIFFAVLGRYRMYRRKGFTVRTSTEGDTLIRDNEMLIVAMARYGGQMERGAACSRTITAPA